MYKDPNFIIISNTSAKIKMNKLSLDFVSVVIIFFSTLSISFCKASELVPGVFPRFEFWCASIQSLPFFKWLWIWNWSKWILIVDIPTQWVDDRPKNWYRESPKSNFLCLAGTSTDNFDESIFPRRGGGWMGLAKKGVMGMGGPEDPLSRAEFTTGSQGPHSVSNP